MSETKSTASAAIYVKKITPQLGWLRPLTEIKDGATGEILRPAAPPQFVMRLRCKVNEGIQELTHLGTYVRFVGIFRAEVKLRDGSTATYVSNNLLLPSVAEGFICLMLDQKMKRGRNEDGSPSESDANKNRTGVIFLPRDNAQSVACVIDLWIAPPQGVKSSQTGYEFEMRAPYQEASFDELAQIGGDLPAPQLLLGATPLDETSKSPTTEKKRDKAHTTA